MTRETDRYQLTISEEQANIICRALEFYERVGGLGQFEVVVEPWFLRCETAALEEARRHLDRAKFHLTGFGYGASYGIYSEEVPDEHRVAYDLQQVIRHRLAWDRTPEGGMGVWFDKPHQTSQVPLAKIEQVCGAAAALPRLADVPEAERPALVEALRGLPDQLAPSKCARCYGCGMITDDAGAHAGCPACGGSGRHNHTNGPVHHVSACAGLSALCGSDSDLCWDGSVSPCYEDGRDITCLPCRAIWLAEGRAGNAEAQLAQRRPSLFARTLAELLAAPAGTSHADWSDILGVSTKTITEWLADDSLPKPEHLCAIVKKLRDTPSVPSELLQQFDDMATRPSSRISPHGRELHPNVAHYMLKPLRESFNATLATIPLALQEQMLVRSIRECCELNSKLPPF